MSVLERIIQRSKDWVNESDELNEYFWIFDKPIQAFSLPSEDSIGPDGFLIESITPEQRAHDAGSYHKENGHKNSNPHHPVHQKALHDAYNHGYETSTVKKRISKTEKAFRRESVDESIAVTYGDLKVQIHRNLYAAKQAYDGLPPNSKQRGFLLKVFDYYTQALNLVRARAPYEQIDDLFHFQNPWTGYIPLTEDVMNKFDKKETDWKAFEGAISDFFGSCFSSDKLGKMVRDPNIALKELQHFLKTVPRGMGAAGVTVDTLKDPKAMQVIATGVSKAYKSVSTMELGLK